MVVIFLGSIPSTYFNAVWMCFFVNLLRQHGLVFNPMKAFKLVWPAFKTLLVGFVPAALLIPVVQKLMPSLTYAPLLLVSLGLLVSAALLHRMLLTHISNTRKWNVAIAILAIVQVVLLGFALSQLES